MLLFFEGWRQPLTSAAVAMKLTAAHQLSLLISCMAPPQGVDLDCTIPPPQPSPPPPPPPCQHALCAPQNKEKDGIGKARVLAITCERKEPADDERKTANGRGAGGKGGNKAAEKKPQKRYTFTLHVCKLDGGTYAVGGQ